MCEIARNPILYQEHELVESNSEWEIVKIILEGLFLRYSNHVEQIIRWDEEYYKRLRKALKEKKEVVIVNWENDEVNWFLIERFSGSTNGENQAILTMIENINWHEQVLRRSSFKIVKVTEMSNVKIKDLTEEDFERSPEDVGSLEELKKLYVSKFAWEQGEEAYILRRVIKLTYK